MLQTRWKPFMVRREKKDTLETCHMNVIYERHEMTYSQGARSRLHNVSFSRLYDVMLDVVSTSLQHYLASWMGHALGPNL
jgi:hypothetical protein